MKNNLLIIIALAILSFFSSVLIFMPANYITSTALGYKATFTRQGVDSEIIQIARERTQKRFEGNPMPEDPVYERSLVLYKLSGPVAVMLVGFLGCCVILFARRDSWLVTHPVKWLWVFFALYLLRTPYLITKWIIQGWIGGSFCWPYDVSMLGDLGINPYIYSPIIGAILLICLFFTLYRYFAPIKSSENVFMNY